MRFDIVPLRFEFVAEAPIHFPPAKAANVLRGMVGMVLPPDVFSPKAESGPSGLADPPRSFVFRVRRLDGASFRPGEAFTVGANFFGPDPSVLIGGFAKAATDRMRLKDVSIDRISLDLAPICVDFDRIRVDFVTPTELKHDGRVVAHPEFPLLAARIRDRVSALRSLYGAGPLDLDFAGFGDRARAVRMTRCELDEVAVERRSSRTGQTHPIGGFTGFAEYEGPLGEFLPFLEAARWTGVGRQAVWGKGEISIARID